MGLSAVIDSFRCCILTWDFLPVVVPAFLLAGAIAVFAPPAPIMRALGRKAFPWIAYMAAVVGGAALGICSCNIVPVAASIRRRGAGLGPAFALLFAGPAVNIISVIWVFHVVGWRMGLWRLLAVPVIAVTVGILTQALFHDENDSPGADAAVAAEPVSTNGLASSSSSGRAATITFILIMLALGARGVPAVVKLPGLIVCGAALAWCGPSWLGRDGLAEWLHASLGYARLVLPILLPAILLLGLIQNYGADWLVMHVYPLVGSNGPVASYTAALVGALMYFPILTEVVVAKLLLRENLLAVGPALALLITGPGLSLPGALLLVRFFGWKRTLFYEVVVTLFGGTAGLLFGMVYGNYRCPCQAGVVMTPAAGSASMYAAIIWLVCIVLTIWRSRSPGASVRRGRTITGV